MQQLDFSIQIRAPKAKVWRTLLDDASYRIWTAVFNPGSYFVGDWSVGSKVLFLNPDGKGLSSEVAKHIPDEFLSIQHLGVVSNGVEDFNSEAVRRWSGALENYSVRETDGITDLWIEMDVEDRYEAYFLETWPKALLKVKELAESA